MIKELLSYVMELAEQMLVSGAEIYRVEECINRIFKAYDVDRVDTFIVTSSMIVSVSDKDGSVYTQTRRITSTGTNIEKLHRLNDISRHICQRKYTLDEIGERIKDISLCPTYPVYVKVLANAVIAGSFTLFFGGGPVESSVSFVLGAVM